MARYIIATPFRRVIPIQILLLQKRSENRTLFTGFRAHRQHYLCPTCFSYGIFGTTVKIANKGGQIDDCQARISAGIQLPPSTYDLPIISTDRFGDTFGFCPYCNRNSDLLAKPPPPVFRWVGIILIMENLLPTVTSTDVISNHFRETNLPYQQWQVHKFFINELDAIFVSASSIRYTFRYS